MKVIVIKTEPNKEIKDANYLRGLKGEIVKYILINDHVNAIILTEWGLFKVIPLEHLGKGHDLGKYMNF